MNPAAPIPPDEALPSFSGNRALDVLIILVGMVLFAAVMQVLRRRREARQATPGAGLAVDSAPAGGIPPEVLAVICAALAATLDSGEHVTGVRELPEGAPPGMLLQQWSLEGRRQIYSSHQFRGGKR
jgi:hypothetical protein